ncbi:unnamed protein product [Adineta ricciae]|uniref:Poly [ADP-ribose] polymerase n=1 Tax=Adineta ricciae TaxID=249248 RepID=A0A813U3G5_ADIRI|nr:unnamed protein product [Adineta ricciae]CAF0817935.1 unnamed protein product [Adineta ricciae]
MSNLAESIIAVFVNKQVDVLSDTELNNALTAQGVKFNPGDVRRQVQMLSPAFFQLTSSHDGILIIRVDPQLAVCEDFLDGRCKSDEPACDKLHICRHFFDRHCHNKSCSFPHNFNQGNNRRIALQNHCQHINPMLLCKLFRRMKTSTMPKPARQPQRGGYHGGRADHRDRRRRGRGRGRGSTRRLSTRVRDDVTRQVEISYPSSNHAPQMNMEMIEVLLKLDDIEIEEKFNEKEDDYFRRRTIQLKQTSDVDKLLGMSILKHRGIDIKFKSVNQTIDTKSFLLKTTINNESDKISQARFALYISILVGKDVKTHVEDLSSENEQIILVQCDTDVDSTQLCRAHESRPHLYGKRISLVQIYVSSAVEVHHNDSNKSMTADDVKAIFQSVWDDIFAYNLPTDESAEVDFISVDAIRRWMSINESMEKKFDVTISPLLDNVEEDSSPRLDAEQTTIPNNNSTTCLTTNSPLVKKSCQTIIKLLPHWALIASHARFQSEYKEFIHNNFGGEVHVNQDEAIYSGTFPSNSQGACKEAILGNKTREFMKQFQYRTYQTLNQDQIKTLQEKSAYIAYKQVNEEDYLVAAKFNHMAELRSAWYHEKQTNHRVERIPPLMKGFSTQNNISKSSSNTSLNSNTSEQFHSLPTMPAGMSSSTYTIYAHEEIIMFSIERFEDRLQQHLQNVFHVKTIIDRRNLSEKIKGIRPCIIVKVTGDENETQNAIQDVMDLFSSKQIKKYDDETDGYWTKINDAVEVIHYHFKLADLTCICERISPSAVVVHYFDMFNPQFGIDEQQIDDIVQNKFSSAVVRYAAQSVGSTFQKEWTDLEEKVRGRNDYKKNICFETQSNAIHLFGVSDLVKEYHRNFEQLKSKHEPQKCPIKLSDKQFSYLKYVAKNDLAKLEARYKSSGCDLSLNRLRDDGEFLAPVDLHSKIKECLNEITQIEELSFEIGELGFDVLVTKNFERVRQIVKPKCYIEKTIDTRREYIPIPKARAADLDEEIKDKQNTTSTTASSASSTATTAVVDHSTVNICVGDLTTQAVDAIVVCSTSQYLCSAIVKKAGGSVMNEYQLIQSSDSFPSVTSAGGLSSKKIFFIPWSADSNDDDDIQTSLSIFIGTAFQYTLSHGFKSIAFPTVGCGGFNISPLTIAKYMLKEIRKQLKFCKQKMNISVVVLADQKDVFDAFVKRLNELITVDPNINEKISPARRTDQSRIAFDRKVVKITLISSTNDHLIRYKQEILNFAREVSITKKLTDKRDMLDWPQKTIYKFYEFCLKQTVIPTLDLDNITLELVGIKDGVHEAEKYFYQLTNEALKQERIHAVSRSVIWSMEQTPNSDTWEQYSFKLNGIIEDAYLKKLPHIEFINDKDEKCRIDFATMVENGSTHRRVRRKPIDSALPSTWEPSDKNCKRVTLSVQSPEYQNVLARFHTTMLGKYTQIVKIERIQNERWYKQYDAHREDFKRRYSNLDERQLFHGCPNTSVDQIIENCFNRSFAGVNGTLYGFGVYFHAQASYSHQYASANSAGHRTMFLASVLIGRTIKGDASMKTVPIGFDTTTDGQHIFVVYHDAGVYADYLIIYK